MAILVPVLLWCMLFAPMRVSASTLADDNTADGFTTFSSGNITGDYIVPYNAADVNKIQCVGQEAFTVFLDGVGVLVCASWRSDPTNFNYSAYEWNDTEGSSHTITFQAGAIPFSYILSGKHIPTRGENPYDGTHHWSWYPDVLKPVTTAGMVSVYNALVNGLVNSWLAYLVGLWIAAMVIRFIYHVFANQISGGVVRGVSLSSNPHMRGGGGGNLRGSGSSGGSSVAEQGASARVANNGNGPTITVVEDYGDMSRGDGEV